MVKANELRIGNLLEVNGKYEPVSYRDFSDSIMKDGVLVVSGNPIPLTPEILEKAGFEKRSEDKYEEEIIYGKLKYTIIYCIADDEQWRFFLNGYHNDIDIRYVHQLQNLYFVISNGEELILNLPSPTPDKPAFQKPFP